MQMCTIMYVVAWLHQILKYTFFDIFLSHYILLQRAFVKIPIFTDFTALCKLYLLCYRTPYSNMMQNGYVICILLFTSVQCNLDKILNSVTEAGFWCINLPVWLFFHCVKTAFGSQKNLIKRRKKWNKSDSQDT